MSQDLDVDESEFEWGDPSVSRPEREQGGGSRLGRVLPSTGRRRTVTFVVVLIPMILTSSFLFAGGAAAISFTADNVNVVTQDGKIQSLTVAPNGTITYKGFEHDASTVDVAVQVQESDGSWTTLSSKSLTASGLSGQLTYDFSAVSILTNSGWSQADFEAADGDSDTQALTIRVRATFQDVGPSQSDITTSNSATFDVTVRNIPAGGGVGGQGNTQGSGNANS